MLVATLVAAGVAGTDPSNPNFKLRHRDVNASSYIGYCGFTDYGGDCSRDVQGAWPLREVGTFDGCYRRCLACERCNFISFSRNADDCSWYLTCKLPLQQPAPKMNHVTFAVRNVSYSMAPEKVAMAPVEEKLTRLKQALRTGDGSAARELLAATPELAKSKILGSSTMLASAIVDYRSSEETLLAILKAYPAAAKSLDGRGRTPLMLLAERYAPSTTNTSLLAALLREHPQAAQITSSDGTARCEGCMPLHAAISRDASDLVILSILTAHVPAVLHHEAWDGRLPLHIAAQRGCSAPLIESLVRAHPSAALAIDYHGYTPLHLALMHRAPLGSVERLLQAAASAASVVGPYGETPLHLAAEYCHSSAIVRAVLKAFPAAVSRRDNSHSTPRDLLLRFWEGADREKLARRMVAPREKLDDPPVSTGRCGAGRGGGTAAEEEEGIMRRCQTGC